MDGIKIQLRGSSKFFFHSRENAKKLVLFRKLLHTQVFIFMAGLLSSIQNSSFIISYRPADVERDLLESESYF